MEVVARRSTNQSTYRKFVSVQIFSTLVFTSLGWSYERPLHAISNRYEVNTNTNLFNSLSARFSQFVGNNLSVSNVVNNAQDYLSRHSSRNADFSGLLNDGATQFRMKKVVGDSASATVRFVQFYRGLEVIGNEALVHVNAEGNAVEHSGAAITTNLSVVPRVTEVQAQRILNSRYGQTVQLGEPAVLKVFRDFDGKTHLVYQMLTRTTSTHDGMHALVDAHTGDVVLDFERAYHVHDFNGDPTGLPAGGKRTVYSADTAQAKENLDDRGYPTDIDLAWYTKAVEDGTRFDSVDRSALNAYRNAGLVYDYYRQNFNRLSYDGQDSRIVSVVHMGEKMNNAFWTTEFGLMAYGDGDGERLNDLTYGVDVAAHEMTHGVTATTANLVYAAESGALNESFSDFFARMVDYEEGNWDIGARIMAEGAGRRALRNMKNPEEFGQPGTNDSPNRVPTTGPCTRMNDRCGVHTNSGIPSRAAVLIVEAIGKENAEQLYYNVLTRRLSSTSNFAETRRETERECGRMFGANSSNCAAVTSAFDTVKM